LGLRDQIRNSLQKEDKKGKPGTWHSRAYHRYFEGYSEVSVPRQNGKGTFIERIYTGNYYRQELSKGQRVVIRILYAVLFLGIAYLFISSAIMPLTSNTTWYVVLPQAGSILFMAWVFIALCTYLPSGRALTIEGYRNSSLALKKATFAVAISLGLSAIVSLLFMVFNPSSQIMAELLCAARYLLGGLLALSMNRIENRLKYAITPSEHQPPENGAEIN
jgi:hypothetical protein